MKSILSNTPDDLKTTSENQLHTLGEWFGSKEKFPKALSYLLESLRIIGRIEIKRYFLCQNNENLHDIHTQIGNYKEAEKYIDKSLQVAYTAKRYVPTG